MLEHTIAILGCGTIGTAVVRGLLGAGLVEPHQILATTRQAEHAAVLREDLGVETGEDNAAFAARADVVLLGVKPQDVPGLLRAPGVAEALSGKLVVSVAAGVRLAQLAALVPDAYVVRAMPNAPAVIREGMTALAPAASVPAELVEVAVQVFGAVGRVRVLDEKHMDAVTALSGSGPAFAAVILEALADGGVMMGLPRPVAMELAAQMVQGTARMVLETGRHPAALKDLVTTPAGSTIAGLLIMEDGRIRSTLARTIQEATNVAGKLGQG